MTKHNIQLIDTHCHLDMDAYQDDLEEVLLRASQAGVCHVVTIGIDRQSSEQAIKLAEQYDSVHATIGIHPHDAEQASNDELDALARLARHPKVVGFGEIGLDYASSMPRKKNK